MWRMAQIILHFNKNLEIYWYQCSAVASRFDTIGAMEKKLVQERDEVVDRIRRELRVLILESGLTQRQVEEANGYAKGYLSQVLNGSITLTVRHMYGVLMAIGVEASEFFARVLPELPRFDEIRERMARYDAALEQLESQGLVKPADESGD